MSRFWGGGWGQHVPQSGIEVAQAFYAGKPRTRSSCRTDGRSYFFVTGGYEVQIARRTLNDIEKVNEVALAIQGKPYMRPLEFSTKGWPTKTTARHFNALGLRAECRGIKNPKFMINDRYMPESYMFTGKWFALDDVRSWPTELPQNKNKRRKN